MSAAELEPKAQLVPSPFAEPTPSQFWQRFDEIMEWCGDRINPIVVKEARQALKSRQFVVTFSLLLVCGACWTALGVASNMPQIMHEPSGAELVGGYYVILCVPMLLIVPFVAYRSLASEREDGTFELLSITSLQARHIVFGKLASAVLQMTVYYSALAPCMAFTYLLKGLDILTIILYLGFLFLTSVLLSSFALALGTVTKSRHWQVLVSVLLVGGLCLHLFWWLIGSAALFDEALRSPPYDQPEFWMFMAGAFTMSLSFIPFFILVASGQISFITDNRSTPIRWVSLAQHILWFGWMLLLVLQIPESANDLHYAFAMAATFMVIYWWIVGSFLVGERGELSPRVRRRLPQSVVGRMLLTWLNPGSGTGFVFVLLNVITFLVALGLAIEFRNQFARMTGSSFTFSKSETMWLYGGTMLAYLALYLGVGRCITLWVRNRVPNTAWFSFLLQIVLLAFGILIPLVIQFSLIDSYDNDYTILQLTNPVWTLAEILMGRYDATQSALVVILMGGIVALWNFAHASVEVHQTRVLAPQRVQAEDAANLAAQTPYKKKNPWDESGPQTSQDENHSP
jgi:ABC-type transport system involved in cytochrome c biogenesis permease component